VNTAKWQKTLKMIRLHESGATKKDVENALAHKLGSFSVSKTKVGYASLISVLNNPGINSSRAS